MLGMWNLVSHTKSRCPFSMFENSKNYTVKIIIHGKMGNEKCLYQDVSLAKIKEMRKYGI